MLASLAESTLYRLERQARRYVEWRERTQFAHQLGKHLPKNLDLGHLRSAAAVKAVCPQFQVLIDIGAHRGQFARAMCSFWEFDEVVCVEPNPELHNEISAALAGRARIHGFAVGAERGEATYYDHPDKSMNSLKAVDRDMFSCKFRFYGVHEITARAVEVKTLGWIFENLRSRSARDILLKLDTQGSELEILRSGGNQLARVSACIVEQMFWGGYSSVPGLDQLVLFMREAGFDCRGVLDLERRKSGEAAYADFLFVRVNAPEHRN